MARIANDYYRTPAAAAAALFVSMPALIRSALEYSRGCVDPCAGDGAIIDAAADFGIRMWGFDIEPRRDDIMKRDALAKTSWSTSPIGVECPSATIMNPPFKRAAEFVDRALEETPAFVAALLRITFIEPTRDPIRVKLLEMRPDVIVLRARPRFRADRKGADFATCAWFTWPGTGTWKLADKAPEIPFLQEA